MKLMLIALNVLLAAGICHLAWITVSDPVVLESKTPQVTRSSSDRKVKQTVPAGRAALKEDPPSVVQEKIAALNAKNIFNVERVPEAPASKAAAARANNQQIRLGMSLVGTYSIGDSLGAIILQRLQGNSQQLLKELQQKEYEQFLASSRVTDPKKKALGQGDAESGDDDGDESGDVVPGTGIHAGHPYSKMNAFVDGHREYIDSVSTSLFICCMYNDEKGAAQAAKVADKYRLHDVSFFPDSSPKDEDGFSKEMRAFIERMRK